MKPEQARFAHHQWPTALLLTSLLTSLGGCTGEKNAADAGAKAGTGGRAMGSGGTAGTGPTQVGGGSGGAGSGGSDAAAAEVPAVECVADVDCGSGQACAAGRCGAKPCNPPKTHFALSIASASMVTLAGAFNGWNPTATPMTFDAHAAMWTVDMSLDAGTYPYKFVVTASDAPADGGGPSWIPDPANPATAPDGFGGMNSLITITCDGVAPADGGVTSTDAPPATDAGVDLAGDRAAEAAPDASADGTGDAAHPSSGDGATGS